MEEQLDQLEDAGVNPRMVHMVSDQPTVEEILETRVTTPQAQRQMTKTFQAREPSGDGSRRVTTPEAHQNDSTATATDSDGKFGHLGQRLLHIWTLALLSLELSVASWPTGTSPASIAAALLRLKLPLAGVLSQDNGQMSKRQTCPP